MHGRLSAVLHEGSPLFAGIPREFQAVRYHSLCVEQPLPEELEPIAWTSDGVLMAVEHRSRPQWGVQFHPESICTEYGRRLLANFRDLTGGVRRRPAAAGRPRSAPAEPAPGRPRGAPVGGQADAEGQAPRHASSTAERAFVHLYGGSENAFWLDSSRVDERARFSFMGDATGPLAATISYEVGRRRGAGRARRRGRRFGTESVFDYLSREMRRMRYLSDDLPFDFNCGFVGYFGYELKADCGGKDAHRSTQPDAAFVFADRLIAFDHLEQCTYVCLCVTEPDGRGGGQRWIAETSLRLASLPPLSAPAWDGAAAAGEPVGLPPQPLARAVPRRHRRAASSA